MAKAKADLRSLARSHTEMCVRTLASIAKSPKAPAAARAYSANSLLDRGWGKAPVQLTGEDGGPLTVIIRQVLDTIEKDDAKLIEHQP